METGSDAPTAHKKEDHVVTEPSIPAEPAPVGSSTQAVEDVPDPDEDDLDDLDDMLDDFSTVKLDTKGPSAGQTTSAPLASQAHAPKPAAAEELPGAEDPFSEDDFAKQLQAGMADLLGELEQSPEMQAQFEQMFKQMAAAAEETAPAPERGASPPTSAGPAPPSQPAADADASFQETIRRTMERMQTSGEQATAAAASGGADDFMSEMLKQLSSGEDGAGGDEDFSKMLMGMMEQLTNKDILYEPMKELDDKFPGWFDKNAARTPADDLKRYEEQRVLVREIVARFEQSTYSDANAADREYIVDRMQKMQAAGSPPEDLVGDLASAQEALAGTEDQCNPQ
ncbi:hypothetical protein HIM_01213 [Hirsutella minnesotensis 3608]|nr:hypothetical protein HIM_01213 [Hirsutella minnesotensis 3608]